MTHPSAPSHSRWIPSWIRRLGLDVRAGEVAVCLALLGLHFFLLAFQYVGKSLRQSTFIDSLGAERLPLVYLAVAVVSYPVLLLYGRLVRGFRLDRLLFGLTALAAVITAGFGSWFQHAEPEVHRSWLASYAAASVAFYLWTAVVAILLVSLFWSLASHVLDARQARRLFGLLGAGGLLGSIAGGQMARLGSDWMGPAGALYLAACVLAATAFLAFVFGRSFGGRCELEEDDGIDDDELDATTADEQPAAPHAEDHVGDLGDEQVGETLRGGLQDGLAAVRRSRYLRLVALLMLLAATVAQIVDLQFGWAVEGATTTLRQRTEAFGNLYSVMGMAAFLFQLLFTTRIHRRLGVGFALRVLPVTNGLGAAAFVVAAVSAPALVLPVLWVVKAAENGIRYSLDQATRELLFVPVPERERPRAKAFVDVFVQRAAKGVAALLLLSVTFGWITVPATAWIALACVVLWLLVVGRVRHRYVAGFRDGLVQRLLAGSADRSEAARLDLRDGATLEVLVAGLGSADSREVTHSVELLDGHGRGRLVPPVMLMHDAPEVRLATLRVLRRGQREESVPWVERLLADPEAPVRAAAIRTLAALSSDDLRRPMESRLQDADPRVRAVAACYLATLDDPDLLALADSSLADMLADHDPQVRMEAASALGELDDPHFQTAIVQLLYDPDERVLRAALHAVRDRARRSEARGASGNPIYVPTVVSLLHRRRLKHEAREALSAYGQEVIPALRYFLLDAQEPIWVRRALPKTIAGIGGEGAVKVLAEALDAADAFLRRKVVEALLGLCRTARSAKAQSAGLPCPDCSLLDDRIGAECREHLRHLLDLWSLEPWQAATGDDDGEPRHLLTRLLEDRLRRQRDLIFGLLALRHPGSDVAMAVRGLGADKPAVRAHALEYLDNLLTGDVRQWLLAVIDDLPRDERKRRAQRLFGLAQDTPADALRRLASRRPAGDVDASWITAAALHFIHRHRVSELDPLVRRAAERDQDPLVQETAAYLLQR